MLATSSLETRRREPSWPRSAASISVSAVPIHPPAPPGERLRKPTTATPGVRDATAVPSQPAFIQTRPPINRVATPAASHSRREWRRGGRGGAWGPPPPHCPYRPPRL